MAVSERVAFILVEDFSHLALSCALESLRIANLVAACELYEWRLASESGKTAISSNGIETLVTDDFGSMPKADYVFVVSGINVNNHINKKLLNCVRRERARGTTLGALCSGAYVLAKAGILDGTKAAIHWEFHSCFEELFPDVDLVPNVFVPDRRYPTAAGGTAVADLFLFLIERKHGRQLAGKVADQMVYASVRSPLAEQRASVDSLYGLGNDHVLKAIEIVEKSIDNPPPKSVVANEIGLSNRQLERLFQRHVGMSPGRYFMQLRLKKARQLLVQTQLPILDVAIACGFQSGSHFAKTYRSTFGVSPSLQKSAIH